MRSVLVVALLASSAAAEPQAPQKLTLSQVTEKALAGPKARMADEDRVAAEARVDEADSARLPKAKITLFGTISPEIRCVDPPACQQTTPTKFALRFSGLFGTAQLDITQPLYTFGKIDHARTAARAGLDAQRALADEAAGDLAVDAARAYWGVKLARELGYMLDDGIEQISAAVAKLDGKKDLSIQDKQRVAVLLAEAKAQRADATQAELEALAGLRALTGMPGADVDDATMEAVARDVPAQLPSIRRPQAIAARRGAVAADELAAFQASQYWPDLAVVGSAIVADAQGVDDPPSVFAYDPYNRVGAGVVLALQWTLEPWTVAARTDRARAEARKAHDLSDLATIGASYDMQSALAETTGAHDRLAAATEGEKAARTWLASVLQAEAIGAAEARDLADSYIAWFQMRARWSLAIFQWNVAVVRLDRAAGEFHAGGHRQ